jgi:hypothetical protein
MFRAVSADSDEPIEGIDQDPLLALLAGYVRNMSAADRERLMRLARWLSRRE